LPAGPTRPARLVDHGRSKRGILSKLHSIFASFDAPADLTQTTPEKTFVWLAAGREVRLLCLILGQGWFGGKKGNSWIYAAICLNSLMESDLQPFLRCFYPAFSP
jgi:hypothetical protein